MGDELKSGLSSIAPILVIGGYAVVFHFLRWARDRYRWTRRTVTWLGRVTRHGDGIVLIWALLADMLAVVVTVFWLKEIR